MEDRKELWLIETNPHQYKVCGNCYTINWISNSTCLECGSGCEFLYSKQKVLDWIELEYVYWINRFPCISRTEIGNSVMVKIQ